MIKLHNVSLSFGVQTLFQGLSCSFNQQQRVGLVGRNGSGKSTLLHCIAGHAHFDSGIIEKSKQMSIAYLPQQIVLDSEKSILEEAFSTFELACKIEKELLALEQLAQKTTDAPIIDRYIELQEQLIEHNPAALRAETKKVLMGLGFTAEQFDAPVQQLSVGWKMRIVLAKLLLKKADFYLFDEPTNHLDIVAKDWFIDFLSTASFGFMLVCHERYILDALTTSTFELEMGSGNVYAGNFSFYEEEKKRRSDLIKQEHKRQQSLIQQKTKTIERFKAKASKAGMAQSMLKQLEKIKPIALAPEPKTVHITFPPLEQAGRVVLTLKNVSHTFASKLLFQNITFHLERGQKVALVASNGVGKTTLFHLVTQALTLQAGSIELGYKVKSAIFEQDQAQTLDLQRTILENIEDRCPPESRSHIRHLLGAFLFSGNTVEKKVAVLSGGEKNRVGMVQVLLQNANFLLLDEPTNHLDIPSKEILSQALIAYPGTLFFVSHDHDFINKIATHIIELTPQGAFVYEGNYASYRYQKQYNASVLQTSVELKLSKPSETKEHHNTTRENKRKIAALEQKITRLEQEINTLHHALFELTYGTPEFQNTEKRWKQRTETLAQVMTKWESLISDEKT